MATSRALHFKTAALGAERDPAVDQTCGGGEEGAESTTEYQRRWSGSLTGGMGRQGDGEPRYFGSS